MKQFHQSSFAWKLLILCHLGCSNCLVVVAGTPPPRAAFVTIVAPSVVRSSLVHRSGSPPHRRRWYYIQQRSDEGKGSTNHLIAAERRTFSSSQFVTATYHHPKGNPIDTGNDIRQFGNDSLPTENTLHTTTTTNTTVNKDQTNDVLSSEERLSCRIIGFYPFPSDLPKGLASWLFKDTHQAIIVRTSASKEKVMMDFMTEGGQTHPVWWDDQVKWRVWFGGTIRGEVRVRSFPRKKTMMTMSSAPNSPTNDVPCGSKSKLQRLTETARAYDCGMNIYGNNCRMFCARMEREVKRLNAENDGMVEDYDTSPTIDQQNGFIASTPQNGATAKQKFLSSSVVADGLLIWRIIGAFLLPALYPLIILGACWGSVF